MGGIFILLSLIGIGLGIFLANTGLQGHGIGATATLIVGVFFAIKEILDILNSRG